MSDRARLRRKNYRPYAGLWLRCERPLPDGRRCRKKLILSGRDLTGDDGVWLDWKTVSGRWGYAGPTEDLSSRYTFDCRCGRTDIQITKDRIEKVTSELLARCKAVDTPLTESLYI